MARLLSWPLGIGLTTLRCLSGPRSVGATSNESVSGFIQTVSSAFGSWRWQFEIMQLRGTNLRRFRGLVFALNGGANAVRYTFDDYDRSSVESGFISESVDQAWSNGKLWSNSRNWAASPPLVHVAASSNEGTTIVNLANKWWGANLDIGDWLGFVPFHLGLYVVTQVIDDRTYRIWPPLRKSVDANCYATLRPTMAMRLENESSATFTRDVAGSKDFTLTLVEVQDADVRDYFNGGDPDMALLLSDGEPLLLG